MSEEYKRCDTCKYWSCPVVTPLACGKCPMYKTDGCGCVTYNFDADGDCPYYEENVEEN